MAIGATPLYGPGGQDFLDADFKFAFVRNPFSRLEGLHRCCVSRLNRPDMTIQTVLDIAERPSREGMTWLEDYIWEHTRPAALAFGLSEMDAIIKREEYGGDAWIERMLGIPAFPHVNSAPGKKRKHRAVFSPHQIETVNRLYREDMERWGYDVAD